MISFSNINKQYGKQLLFVDASFQLNPGEKVGLVGPNAQILRRSSGANLSMFDFAAYSRTTCQTAFCFTHAGIGIVRSGLPFP